MKHGLADKRALVMHAVL